MIGRPLRDPRADWPTRGVVIVDLVLYFS